MDAAEVAHWQRLVPSDELNLMSAADHNAAEPAWKRRRFLAQRMAVAGGLSDAGSLDLLRAAFPEARAEGRTWDGRILREVLFGGDAVAEHG